MTLPTLAWIHLPRVNMGRNLFASLQRFKVDLRLSRMMSSIRPPDDRLKESLVFPVKTLTGPGPSNCSERVLNANKLPMVGHLHKEFIKVIFFLSYSYLTLNVNILCLKSQSHTHSHAYTRTFSQTHAHTITNAHTQTHARSHTHARPFSHTHTHTHVCSHKLMNVHTR